MTDNPSRDYENHMAAQEQKEALHEAAVDWAVAKLTAELQDPKTVSDAMLVLFENTSSADLAEFFGAGDKMAASLGGIISDAAEQLIKSGDWKFEPEERDDF